MSAKSAPSPLLACHVGTRCPDGLCKVADRADLRTDAVDGLSEATALHLRMLGRWQPGTLAALLDPATLPGTARLDQLIGGAP